MQIDDLKDILAALKVQTDFVRQLRVGQSQLYAGKNSEIFADLKFLMAYDEP